jgi:hypothetical protein
MPADSSPCVIDPTTINNLITINNSNTIHNYCQPKASKALDLKCVVLNARSVCNKLTNLYHLLYSSSLDIVFITETWLYDGFPNGLLDPLDKYRIERLDRTDTRGGGVCILISKNVDFSRIPNASPVELLCIDILIETKKYRFITIYRPPKYGPPWVANMDNMVKILKKLCDISYPVFIIGDLNCPGVHWQTYSAPCDTIQDIFCDFVCDYGFMQFVNEPTHDNNVLDIVLANEPLLISDVQVDIPLGNSDHNVVRFTITDSVDCSVDCTVVDQNMTKKFIWEQADYNAMSAYILNVDWLKILSVNLTTETLWGAFCDVLNKAIDLFVPFKLVSNQHANNKTRKYPAGVRKALAHQRCLWRLLRISRDNLKIENCYKEAQANSQRLIWEFEKSKEENVIKSNNVGKFYKYINKKLSYSSGVGALRNSGGMLITDNLSRANVLNDYFTSVCTVDNGSTPSVPRTVPPNVGLTDINFSTSAILRAIKRIKPNASSGPDGFPPSLVKQLAPSLAVPLSLLFASFISVGQVPSAWKTAIVTPIYKAGLASEPSNYRPISLTSVFCKLMERIIADEILTYLRQHKLLGKEQHGFLKKRSTSSNLLESLNDWTLTMKNHHGTVIAYIDYTKAFDSVCHNKLFAKLSSMGIGGKLLLWIQTFLTGRSQRTRVGETLSNNTSLNSGIVQGSCLGPLLFIMFINDVSLIFDNSVICKMYADDVKLYTEVETDSDVARLQGNLDRLIEWSDQWQLSISIKKCAILQLGTVLPTLSCSIKGETLPSVKEFKDLGVIVDSTLKFRSHVSSIVAKARTRASLIFKCFLSRDCASLLKAYITYVRPLVEYSSSVWSPHHVIGIDQVESVQRRFTKRLPGMDNLSYTERLTKLSLDSLQLRRLKFDLILTYKIIFGLVDTNVTDFFIMRTSSTTRGHPYKIFAEHCSLDCRKYFFSNRVTEPWNNLPLDTNFSSLYSFKKSINIVDFTKFIKY